MQLKLMITSRSGHAIEFDCQWLGIASLDDARKFNRNLNVSDFQNHVPSVKKRY
jgi:hypothetical protein